MPRLILDLPDEILDISLEILLPRLASSHGSSPLHRLESTPNPVDLCRVLQTCSRLHHLAFPWVWRRLHFTTGASTRWEYLRENPQAASHVRLFVANVTSDHHSYDSEIVGVLLPVLRAMQNLRLAVFGLPHLRPQSIETLFTALVAQPGLHTLLALHPVTISGRHGPLNLRRLYYDHDSNENSQWNFDETRQLDSLALAYTDVENKTVNIPWASLRKFEIAASVNCKFALDSLSKWKKKFPNKTLSLTEVSINTMNANGWAILEALRGQSLRSLSLLSVPHLDRAFLQALVSEFPQLQTLGLFSGRVSAVWPILLDDIAGMLGRLPVLTSLDLNCVGGAGTTFYPHPPAIYWKKFGRVLSVVGEHCTALQDARFHNAGRIYAYERTEEGDFRKTEGSSVQYGFYLRNSGWDCSQYEHV